MKVDKIFPNNWKEVVRGKKVILYNTGVSSLLHGREKRIEKMRWVFQVFKEHPGVVLWWRPHPLELSTLQSMLPELEEQYKEVCRWYQEEIIGILDESADLNRAIAISDAYYGAWSSVVELYKAAKKPILFENNKVWGTEAASFLPSALCIKNEDIWFIQEYSNKLIKMNKTTYEAEEIISIPCEPPFRSRPCGDNIIDIGESLLLLLEKSEKIYEYEIGTGAIKIYEAQIENDVYSSKLIIEQRKLGERNIKAAKCHEVIDSKLYMVDSRSNTLYVYDLSDESTIEMHIGEESSKYLGVKKAGKYFVLPHIEKKAITLWSESGEIIELNDFPERYTSWEEHAYFDMFERNGNMYIFPYYGNMVLEVDVKNKVIIPVFDDLVFDADYNINSEDCSENMYSYVGEHNERIWAYSLIRRCWQIFNLDTMDVQEIFLPEIEKEQHKILLECLLDNKRYKNSFYEFEKPAICTLENYIKNLTDNYEGHCAAEYNENDLGIKIHKCIVNEL